MNLERVRARPLTTAVVIALEMVERLCGRHEPLTPPLRLVTGGPHYRAVGEEFKGHMIRLGGLGPGARVLDIGCGVGRMAVPLLDYLEGEYEGFDVVPVGIAWCRRHITRRNRQFRFRVADVRNAMYNPDGRWDASSYEFPYPDAHFDFALATSVFTHLLPDATRNYLAQARRVLRPGGTLFATFFLLDEREPTEAARFVFDVPGAGYRTTNPTTPESAVAYGRHDLERLLADAGLTVRAFYAGTWTGLPGTSFQDIVIAAHDSARSA
jgi:SAM-dependent methyltransferase